MKRLFLPILLAVAVIVSVTAASLGMAGEPRDIRIVVDGLPLQKASSGQLVKGTAMGPLRSLAVSMGAEITWEKSSGSIRITKDDLTILMKPGEREAVLNGKNVLLNPPPFLSDGTTFVSVRWISEQLGAKVKWLKATRTVAVEYKTADNLPIVGSYEYLRTLLLESETARAGMYRGMTMKAASDDIMTMESAEAPRAEEGSGAADSGSYSKTNVQVQGVDEADVVKTDGKYIYQVNRQNIIITEAYPAEQLRVVNTIRFDQPFMPQEIYVDETRLIVIGTSYESMMRSETQPGAGEPSMVFPAIEPEEQPQKKLMDQPAEIPSSIAAEKMMIAPYYEKPIVKSIVYDISDKSNVQKVREAELEGHYISSRKVGSALYVVANKYIDTYYIMEEGMKTDGSMPQAAASSMPAYRDSAVSTHWNEIDYEHIRYFPEQIEPNYLIIGGLDLDSPEQAMQVSAYLGSGQNVYASTDNLYVAVTQYVTAEQSNRGIVSDSVWSAPNTVVYKFALRQGAISFSGKGEVPGTIINQYSMDEYEGHFRIATTKGDMWRTDEFTSKNNVYILDEAMVIVGKIEDLAPGERIYSVRFTGNRGYIVTFKTVDPLFVLDLRRPEAPKLLGALKIPGYSDYLHPYDENHLIGFGKETIELSRYDERGNSQGSTAYYLGMKVALFDVTDVTNPIQKFSVNIGDRGTDSELLRNPKALLFSKEKQLLAFPVTVMEVKNNAGSETTKPDDMPAYGEFAFQGAYVYSLDIENGFQLRAKLTHISEEDYKKAGMYGYDGMNNIQRLLYIRDTLYSLSDNMIQAHDIPTMQEKNRLLLQPK